MKKVLMLAVLVLGTTTMVNAQTAPSAKAEVKKEVRHTKKATKKAEKAAVKAETATAKIEAPKAKK